MSRNNGAALRITGWILIALGAFVLEFALYTVVGTTLVTKGHQTELRKEFEALVDSPAAAPSATSEPRPMNSRAIGLMKIPKIGVDVIVVEGTRLGDLSYGPGRYSSTAAFGAPGSTAVAGHRTGWGSPFLNLDKMEPGDAITVESVDGTVYSYRVTKHMIVGASDSWVLAGNRASGAKSQLTLTTCDPKFTSRNRLIVWADLISTKGAS